MILYHGSITEIPDPQILKNEMGRDFGFAFYTTDIQEQAEQWAIRKARLANRRQGKTATGIVSSYEWDESSSTLDIMRFQGASMEWLELVVKCRSDIDFSHNYDVVIGNIANDNVGETVSYVVQGIMRKEDAIERLKFEKINNHIAFCTKRALEELIYRGFYEMKE